VTETNADSVAVLVAGLNASARRLDASLAQLAELSVSLSGLSTRLDTTLAAVNSPDGTLGLLLTDPSLYHNANAAAASLQQVLQDLQADPNRYLRGVVRVF
jgi:phospholipid/cholesterol/gamma-HCH transport system substrate-binding protein